MKYSPGTITRFWSKVDKRGPDECWPWLGHCQKGGYGQFGSGGGRLTHRIAYELLVGELTRGGQAVIATTELAHVPGLPGDATVLNVRSGEVLVAEPG